MTALRIGTRGSALARAQTGGVADALAARHGREVELVIVTTEGDRSTRALSDVGGTGVFAGALRAALLADEVDVVVHSLKDLPTLQPPGLAIAAVPRREDPRDALCSRDGAALAALPAGARVGTGSPRRQAQLRAARADLEVVDIRGNIDTRLKRLDDDLDAVLLAAAGLERIGRRDAVAEHLGLDDWPTAPGQGALAVETRAGEERLAQALEHRPSRVAVEAERGVLAALEAGCAAPIAARAFAEDGLLYLTARVYAPDGSGQLTSSHALYSGDSDDPARELAERVAEELLEQGAADLAPLARVQGGAA